MVTCRPEPGTSAARSPRSIAPMHIATCTSVPLSCISSPAHTAPTTACILYSYEYLPRLLSVCYRLVRLSFHTKNDFSPATNLVAYNKHGSLSHDKSILTDIRSIFVDLSNLCRLVQVVGFSTRISIHFPNAIYLRVGGIPNMRGANENVKPQFLFC